MLQLKQYQEEVVTQLEEYLNELKNYKNDSANLAFYKLTGNIYKQRELKIPFVCIKIATGGGKTLVACHSINSLYNNYLQYKADRGLIVWLVPTDAIRIQTLSALKNYKHPYRQTLNHFFSNKVQVFDFKEALSIKKSDIENNLCIIVSTLSSFRITHKEGRRAYADNGSLLEHFEDDPENKNQFSLVNVIKKNNPLIILDEGHNATTSLSIDMFSDLNPCFILEFTATPREQSNVLVNISAKRLQEEHMVKIPIYLHNVAQWQATIREGIAKREYLEKLASKEKDEYIRPVVLLQAEQEKLDDKKIYVSQIKEYLINELKIPDNQIAIRTGTKNEIKEIDLFSKKCPIRYIITVSALKEGWDFSFAYVLISVANIESRIFIEQTLGRVLRLPNQKLKVHHELNYSYVYTSSRTFEASAKALEKGLLQHGYSKKDFKILPSDNKITEITHARKFKDELKIPCIAVNTGKNTTRLKFHINLLGSDFKLSNQLPPDDYLFYFDENRRQKIDVDKEDKLKRFEQKIISSSYSFMDFDKPRLLNWLDKKILLKEYTPKEKRAYFEKIIDRALEKIPLQELSLNCYKLKELIIQHVNNIELTKAYNTFKTLEMTNRLILDKVYYTQNDEKIKIDNPSEVVFNKHLFESAGELNREELGFILKIDNLEEVKFWYRNNEKVDFFIQGWHKNKFYPDFIIKLKSDKILIVEYKGLDRITNSDTKYKQELGLKYQHLCENKIEFYLVSLNTVEDFINNIKSK